LEFRRVLFRSLKDFVRLALTHEGTSADCGLPPSVAVQRQAHDPVQRLREQVQRAMAPGNPVRLLLCADAAGRRETIAQMLGEHDLHPVEVGSIHEFLQNGVPFGITVAPLSAGFSLPHLGIVFLTESDLYPGHTSYRTRRVRERTTN